MDISKITEYMYIAAHPKAEAASTIQALGVRLIINMIFYRPADIYKKPPFKLLTLRSFDSPFLPIQLSKLRKGVKTALPFIQNGDSVLIYCREGKHRSVAIFSLVWGIPLMMRWHLSVRNGIRRIHTHGISRGRFAGLRIQGTSRDTVSP